MFMQKACRVHADKHKNNSSLFVCPEYFSIEYIIERVNYTVRYGIIDPKLSDTQDPQKSEMIQTVTVNYITINTILTPVLPHGTFLLDIISIFGFESYRSVQHVRDEVVGSFDVFYREIVSRKPVFQSEDLWVSKSFFEESSDSGKGHDYAILMANTTEHTETIYDSPDDEVTSSPQRNNTKPNSGPWFTLDDVPPSFWRRRLIEFGAWLDTKLMKDPDSYKVIEEFCCIMTGTLKEWYHHLGAVRQNQLHELGSSAAILGILHEEFIGDGGVIDKKIRQEYYEMKCCSIKMKDLDKHFQRMLRRFYLLNGPNDPSLKNTYVASLLEELQPEINRMAMAAQKEFSTMSMGQIHQMTQEALDKLCRQHKYFSDVLKQKGKFNKSGRNPDLEIKFK
ncbi:hypothetical protein CR513_61742, partial [Mucuna pruriens]